MKIRLAGNIQPDSIVDGEGIRTVIWTQGCSHNCEGCHNPETHAFTAGTEVDVEKIEEQISNLEGQDGVTLSGGDPFFQVEASLEIARYCKSIGLNVWAYTGFKYEELISNNKTKELLKNIDVLVDGKFEKDKKSLVLRFRGSSNQRIIDVNKSLELGKIVVKEDKLEETYCKPEGLFI